MEKAPELGPTANIIGAVGVLLVGMAGLKGADWLWRLRQLWQVPLAVIWPVFGESSLPGWRVMRRGWWVGSVLPLVKELVDDYEVGKMCEGGSTL